MRRGNGLSPGHFFVIGKIRIEFFLVRADFGANKPFVALQGVTNQAGVAMSQGYFAQDFGCLFAFFDANELNGVFYIGLGFDPQGDGFWRLLQVG